jgi:hypothetical protein
MGRFRTTSAGMESISAEDRKMLARFQKRFGQDVEILKNAEKLKALHR